MCFTCCSITEINRWYSRSSLERFATKAWATRLVVGVLIIFRIFSYNHPHSRKRAINERVQRSIFVSLLDKRGVSMPCIPNRSSRKIFASSLSRLAPESVSISLFVWFIVNWCWLVVERAVSSPFEYWRSFCNDVDDFMCEELWDKPFSLPLDESCRVETSENDGMSKLLADEVGSGRLIESWERSVEAVSASA